MLNARIFILLFPNSSKLVFCTVGLDSLSACCFKSGKTQLEMSLGTETHMKFTKYSLQFD